MEFKSETKKNKVVFIAGLTASGKSDLAIWLARRVDGEIINADSRQVYFGLDFGSAKISKTEEKKVKHYLLSFASPRQNYSLGRWLEDADQAVKKIIRAGRMPIFCGGALLYLKSLVEGWRLVKVKPNRKLRKDLEKKTLADLLLALKKIDPVRLKTVDRNNKRRIIRAIEIGRQLGSVPVLKKQPQYEVLILAPRVEFSRLELKIAKRLSQRRANIVKEIKNLRRKGLSFDRIINFGLEYRWFGRYLRGDIDLIEAEEKCLADIIRFAKRQRRELERISVVHWVKTKIEALSTFKKFLK